MTMTPVQITRIDEPAELFYQFPPDGRGRSNQEGRPQPCYLTLNLESGEMTCRYNSEIGTNIPKSVYQQRVIWVSIPCLTATAANRLMDEVAPIAQRILAGAEIVWDGHNHVGRLDDDAQAGVDALAERCAPEGGQWPDSDTVSAWDAADWFGGEGREQTIERLGLTADTTDDQIAEMARQEEADARASSDAGYVILIGGEDYLTELREELRAAITDELAEVAGQIATLTERRNDLICRVVLWGYSSRRVSEYAGVSHTQVQNIANAKRAKVTVTLPGAEYAQYIAEMPQLAANGSRVEVDGATVTLGRDALDVLAGLADDYDGHFDGTCIWIGGSAYAVNL
jgi:hypothetical protein